MTRNQSLKEIALHQEASAEISEQLGEFAVAAASYRRARLCYEQLRLPVSARAMKRAEERSAFRFAKVMLTLEAV